jgi:hypothetical protein
LIILFQIILEIITMNINPLTGRGNDNDSKRYIATKQIAHDGLMPVSLKMLSRCVKERKRQIDGVEFLRLIVVVRVESVEQKGTKTILVLNDNSDTVRAVNNCVSEADEL